MKNNSCILLVYSLLIMACSTENKPIKRQFHSSVLISSAHQYSDAPFLTSDEKGNAVLSWVEGKDDSTMLYYAVSNGSQSFGQPIAIPPTKGLKVHHESMPKIAFKDDGTIIAVYGKKTPSPKNRFAGAIFYTQSFDKGSHWTDPQFLHYGDTTLGIGRSFFDIARLSNGEIGAIWLDGRKKSRKGSTLFFAKTSNKEGFVHETELATKTCQCCRTDIFVEEANRINVAFRHIFNDSIRDIAHLYSTDNGNTFTAPERISEDNWIINGCPHTGPTMTENEKGLQFFWYTLGGDQGVYSASVTNDSFSLRKLINPHARHPQSAQLNNNGNIVLVWDENFKTDKAYINKVGVSFQDSTYFITADSVDASHPVVQSFPNGGFVTAWTQKQYDRSEVHYCFY